MKKEMMLNILKEQYIASEFEKAGITWLQYIEDAFTAAKGTSSPKTAQLIEEIIQDELNDTDAPQNI